VAISADQSAPLDAGTRDRLALELRGLREENRTLYGVIKLVSSPLELEPMLLGVVDLATEASGCHACFIYLLEGSRLTIRAASPVFSEAVGRVQFSVDEGLTGWVARHRTPEFIRDQAMKDPRMKYVPLLQEQRFQSMAAVPILSRAGETIGVIVLHTEAPHEFDDSTLRLLVHIASLVSGAIENAQLYGQERRRVDALTGLSELAQRVSDASGTLDLATVLATGSRQLLKADICQLLRLGPDGDTFELLASVPESLGPPAVGSASQLMLAALEGGRGQLPGPLWPSAEVADLLVTPMAAGGERVGLLCAASLGERTFGEEDTEIGCAVANLGAMAIRRLELIEGLTNANIIKDLFEALAAGATSFAAAKAAEVRCDLTTQYLMLCAEPSGRLEQSSGAWRLAAEDLGRGLAELVPRCAIEAGPGPVRALLSFGQARRPSVEGLLPEFRELGQRAGAAIGVSEPRESPGDAPGAYREARDAATIAQALLRDGGAIAYSQVGAYRYLVQIGADDAPRDRMRAAVDRLIAYDRKRRTALLDTLERYLSERRSVIESARALFIHPNTLRQRLGRIEELTGLNLDEDDLLSLELAIKLARLHGRPNPGPAAAG
jgi:GAF domain-containing protein